MGLNMSRLYVMMGLPRSGKTTIVENNFDDAVIVSADRLRKRIYGQRFLKMVKIMFGL